MTDTAGTQRITWETLALPWIANVQSRGVLSSVLVMLTLQVITTALAVVLDYRGFPDATAVIVYVLGVMLTTMLTPGQAYSLISSIISILSYNFFLIYPRFSLAIDGLGYASTLAAMFLFSLIESNLMAVLRKNERLSMEARLLAQREQLRADLLRSVSHDLRTPLTSISGNADMLLDEDARLSPEVQRSMIQDIYDDATWLSDVVQNLLGITRLEDADVHLQMSAELVDEVMEEAMRHISRDASRHVISVVPPADLCLAYMEPHVIAQVIVNLVNNAIAHTPEGSRIVLSASHDASNVIIRVSDNGPGIPDADKERVFESFYTSTDNSADSRRGVGLGLSLCKAIIEVHKGSIWVEDTEGGGATFAFTLPLEEVF